MSPLNGHGDSAQNSGKGMSDRRMQGAVWAMLDRIFENDAERVNRWLREPNRNFGNIAPAQVAQNRQGLELVFNYVFHVVKSTPQPD